MKEALRKLAAILNSEIEPYPTENSLLIAMVAVGKVLDITIIPPKGNRSQVNSVEAVARNSGFRVRRITLDDVWWQQDYGPLLGFIATETEERPVALLPKKGRGYEIFDPVNFKRIPVGFATAKHLSPKAYIFYRPFPDRPLSLLNLVQFVFRGRYSDIINTILFGVLASLAGMLVPQATAVLVDSVIPDGHRGLLLQIGIGLLAASFAMTILQLTRNILTLRWQTAMSADMQAAVWQRLLRLQTSFFRQYSTGDIQNRVSAISQIHSSLNSTLMTTLLSSFFSLLNLVLLFYYSISLAMVAIVVAAITSVVTIIVGIITQRKFRPLQELNGKILGLMVQTLDGIAKLRVAAAEDRAFTCWAKKYSQKIKLTLSAQQAEDFLSLFNTAIPGMTAIALFSFAVASLSKTPGDGGLSAGQFLAFNAAFGAFIGGTTSLSSTIVSVLEISVLWDQAQPILHAVPETTNQGADPGELSGAIELDRVWFRYGQNQPWVLSDLTLEAKPGEFIGITGLSGSGKSTIVRLLLGFETPVQGVVMYDGRDLTTLDISEVRSQLGVVLQNSRLMGGSIWEIIAGGVPITLDQAWEAAKMAGLDRDIHQMPMQMHTRVSEGGGDFSGGQRQRLLIARSLVRQPRILIFDEATSALDNQTQELVTQSLEKLGVTRIVVAHRQSTIRGCDRVYRL
ncbi:MAG: NHLP bacteriocin export ABC transporter permease/ATPase subunit [Crinalium sp.]